jgi:hypothetical protein
MNYVKEKKRTVSEKNEGLARTMLFILRTAQICFHTYTYTRIYIHMLTHVHVHTCGYIIMDYVRIK